MAETTKKPRGRPKKIGYSSDGVIREQLLRERLQKELNPDIPDKVYQCTKCGEAYDAPGKKFFKNKWSPLWVNNGGYVNVCTRCLESLCHQFADIYGKRKAVMICCHYADFPFVQDLFEKFAAESGAFPFDKYIRKLYFEKYDNMTFKTSIVDDELSRAVQPTMIAPAIASPVAPVDETVKWSKGDLHNKESIVSYLGYDPYSDDVYTESDRKYLYNTLSGYLTDDVLADPHRTQSVVDMVVTLLQRSKIDRLINAELLNPTPTSNLKAYSDAKDKFDKSINTAANDNGFSAKSSGKLNQNISTLTSIMREMQQKNFDDCKVNITDVKMTPIYKQIADASNQSLFEQLNYNEDDYARMVATQRELIAKLNEEKLVAEEENRKLRLLCKRSGVEIITPEEKAKQEAESDGES